MHIFNLDCCKYISLPSLAYACALKLSKVRMGLISCHDIQLFVESHVKGGFSLISGRFYEKSDICDALGYLTSLIVLDVNNLYGFQMTRPLSIGEATWVKKKHFEKIDWTSVSEEDAFGYIVECDLHFPKESHKWFSSFPPAPERMTVTEDMLSSFHKTCHELSKGPNKPFVGQKKLISTLGSRIKYGLHSIHLRTLIGLGMKLGTVHRVLRFRQERWLKSFVETCTELRKNATSTFDKSCWKLM